MVEARVLTRLKLSLSNSGLERNVPKAGSLALVGLTASQVAQERGLSDLAGALTDRLVMLLPIHGQTKVAPQRLELSLIFNRQTFAELNEILT